MSQHPKDFDKQYDDGLDDEVARSTRIARPTRPGERREMKTAAELAAERGSEPSRPFWIDIQLMSVPLFAGFVFGICGALAAGSVEFTLRSFAEEAGLNRIIFVAVPALFAMLFAIVVFQDARAKITRVAQSVSRGILVALLTWAAFSALATFVWCRPENYGSCYGNFLLISGIVGGGPMLIA
ncbi:MAG: hypothetical protein MUC68_15125, partial [Burkholderiaceae bacterium]|nr:hypothetical protein [Burkholderiaceae bacterium]